ncbi:hypothetical protein MB14_02865 [Roseivirga ehrenbergii]|uniref:DUF3857 domain-containing protein n=2 Tax=Roseivirga ehrenbergii (strain DSM 102268 / JCM 13514 / KCTC 12282 / NCIMB 14502 / KMM 6017) TaxID=279360 RepID=A0A150XBU5_ROSEK|nr:hypothetical protein MB14_02865 [Roseivirga ehrenbergii]
MSYFNVTAQVESHEFGKIDKADLEMTVYSPDSGAAAVYLVDKGRAIFNESSFDVYLTQLVRIKILKEEGFKWADIKLDYLKGNGLSKLKAATYNLENGKIVKTELGKRDWVDEKINDDLWSKKASLPDVKVGSIIEYTYTRKTGDFSRLPAWIFQTSIPVRYSEYEIDIPRYGDYQTMMKGYIQPAFVDNSGGKNHIVMKNVSALDNEPYVATMENFRSKIEFEIKAIDIPGYFKEVYMENWEAINDDLLKDEVFGKALEATGQIKRAYPDDKGWKNDEASLIEIYNFVRDNYEWDERGGLYMLNSPRQTWDDKKASAPEINMTLIMFLRNAGISADPVILSTRGHGYLNTYVPIISQFNRTIASATIDGKTYLMDATNKLRPYNVLPTSCLNGQGLKITSSGPEWVDLSMNKETDTEIVTGNLWVNEDDVLEGNMNVVFKGTASTLTRDTIEDLEKEDLNDVFEDFDGEIENVSFKDADEAKDTVEGEFDFTKESGVSFIGDKIFLNPVLSKFIKENPFKLEARLYPVEFSAPIINTYMFNVTIPEGYEIEELPVSQNIALPDNGGRYTYLSGVQGDKIQVVIRLNLYKTSYLPDEYPLLKEFFNQIIAKQEGQIVFKKKGSKP